MWGGSWDSDQWDPDQPDYGSDGEGAEDVSALALEEQSPVARLAAPQSPRVQPLQVAAMPPEGLAPVGPPRHTDPWEYRETDRLHPPREDPALPEPTQWARTSPQAPRARALAHWIRELDRIHVARPFEDYPANWARQPWLSVHHTPTKDTRYISDIETAGPTLAILRDLQLDWPYLTRHLLPWVAEQGRTQELSAIELRKVPWQMILRCVNVDATELGITLGFDDCANDLDMHNELWDGHLVSYYEHWLLESVWLQKLTIKRGDDTRLNKDWMKRISKFGAWLLDYAVTEESVRDGQINATRDWGVGYNETYARLCRHLQGIGDSGFNGEDQGNVLETSMWIALEEGRPEWIRAVALLTTLQQRDQNAIPADPQPRDGRPEWTWPEPHNTRIRQPLGLAPEKRTAPLQVPTRASPAPTPTPPPPEPPPYVPQSDLLRADIPWQVEPRKSQQRGCRKPTRRNPRRRGKGSKDPGDSAEDEGSGCNDRTCVTPAGEWTAAICCRCGKPFNDVAKVQRHALPPPGPPRDWHNHRWHRYDCYCDHDHPWSEEVPEGRDIPRGREHYESLTPNPLGDESMPHSWNEQHVRHRQEAWQTRLWCEPEDGPHTVLELARLFVDDWTKLPHLCLGDGVPEEIMPPSHTTAWDHVWPKGMFRPATEHDWKLWGALMLKVIFVTKKYYFDDDTTAMGFPLVVTHPRSEHPYAAILQMRSLPHDEPAAYDLSPEYQRHYPGEPRPEYSQDRIDHKDKRWVLRKDLTGVPLGACQTLDVGVHAASLEVWAAQAPSKLNSVYPYCPPAELSIKNAYHRRRSFLGRLLICAMEEVALQWYELSREEVKLWHTTHTSPFFRKRCTNSLGWLHRTEDPPTGYGLCQDVDFMFALKRKQSMKNPLDAQEEYRIHYTYIIGLAAEQDELHAGGLPRGQWHANAIHPLQRQFMIFVWGASKIEMQALRDLFHDLITVGPSRTQRQTIWRGTPTWDVCTTTWERDPYDVQRHENAPPPNWDRTWRKPCIPSGRILSMRFELPRTGCLLWRTNPIGTNEIAMTDVRWITKVHPENWNQPWFKPTQRDQPYRDRRNSGIQTTWNPDYLKHVRENFNYYDAQPTIWGHLDHDYNTVVERIRYEERHGNPRTHQPVGEGGLRIPDRPAPYGRPSEETTLAYCLGYVNQDGSYPLVRHIHRAQRRPYEEPEQPQWERQNPNLTALDRTGWNLDRLREAAREQKLTPEVRAAHLDGQRPLGRDYYQEWDSGFPSSDVPWYREPWVLFSESDQYKEQDRKHGDWESFRGFIDPETLATDAEFVQRPGWAPPAGDNDARTDRDGWYKVRPSPPPQLPPLRAPTPPAPMRLALCGHCEVLADNVHHCHGCSQLLCSECTDPTNPVVWIHPDCVPIELRPPAGPASQRAPPRPPPSVVSRGGRHVLHSRPGPWQPSLREPTPVWPMQARARDESVLGPGQERHPSPKRHRSADTSPTDWKDDPPRHGTNDRYVQRICVECRKFFQLLEAQIHCPLCHKQMNCVGDHAT